MTNDSVPPVRRKGSIRALTTAAVAAGLVVLVLVGSATPAVGSIGRPAVKFTTGKFAVTCTSTGLLCSPAKKLRFTLHHRGVLTTILYTTPATHCSAIKLRVYRHGHQIAQTGTLAAGVQTERLKTHIWLREGVTTLGFKGQGFLGGCNVGQTGSWGGKVTITVKFPTPN